MRYSSVEPFCKKDGRSLSGGRGEWSSSMWSDRNDGVLGDGAVDRIEVLEELIEGERVRNLWS